MKSIGIYYIVGPLLKSILNVYPPAFKQKRKQFLVYISVRYRPTYPDYDSADLIHFPSFFLSIYPLQYFKAIWSLVGLRTNQRKILTYESMVCFNIHPFNLIYPPSSMLSKRKYFKLSFRYSDSSAPSSSSISHTLGRSWSGGQAQGPYPRPPN